MFSIHRANRRLAEANSKLLNERSRSFITSSIANGSLGSPALDVGTSPANYGATLGPLNRGLGLGLSILRPVTDTQNSRVEDYLAKVCTCHELAEITEEYSWYRRVHLFWAIFISIASWLSALLSCNWFCSRMLLFIYQLVCCYIIITAETYYSVAFQTLHVKYFKKSKLNDRHETDMVAF